MFKQLKVNKSSRYRRRNRAEVLTSLLFSSSSSDDDSMEVSLFSGFKNTISPQSQMYVTSIVNTSQNENSIDELNHQEPNNIVEQFNEFESSLDSSSSSDSEQTPNLRLIIAIWAIRHDITHYALNDLLKSLSILPAFSELPKDART
ncbi:unnamed protein product [Macrosiphum euphorbiae]|uniref:Uncharacterized protein n=1 Tax=Macrosiphum euphorbiae TaxID=13131 RepID=A0AAV0WU24_9HEMI|nr:unnamed protein product [Macrosiphum euphorbiae]